VIYEKQYEKQSAVSIGKLECDCKHAAADLDCTDSPATTSGDSYGLITRISFRPHPAMTG